RPTGRDEGVTLIVIARRADRSAAAMTVVKTTTLDPPPKAIELRLAPTGTARFRVAHADGEPVAGAEPAAGLELRGFGRLGPVAEADPSFERLEEGHFRATGLVPGCGYRLRAGAKGFRCPRALTVTVEPGQDADAGTLTLDREDKAAEGGERPRADLWRQFPGLKRRHEQGRKRLEDWLTSLEPVAFAAQHGALVKQARSADRAARLRAWKAIAALRDPAAVPLLLEAARSEDPREQAEAMAALATWVYDAYHPARRVPRDLAPLLPFFVETLTGLGDRPNARSSCFQAIGCLAGAEWLPLVKALAPSRHPSVAHWSAWAMKEVAARAPAAPAREAGVQGAAGLPRWADSRTGEVWFSVGDIVRFDWEKQLFELSRRRAMGVMVNELRLRRKFTLRDGQGVIYRGAFTSPASSFGFAEPAIVLGPLGDGPRPPLFRIDAGYPGKIGGRDDRFAPRLKAALERAGVLAAIDPDDPRRLSSASVRSGASRRAACGPGSSSSPRPSASASRRGSTCSSSAASPTGRRPTR
ncbi:MAG: hypothetical protein ACOC8D_02650, partial [bacterium]